MATRRRDLVLDMLESAVELIGRAPGGGILRSATPTSVAVLAVGFAAWVGAWGLGWVELAVLAGGCLVAPVVAAAFTIGRAEVAVTLELDPPRVSIGERAVGRVQVTNVSAKRLLPLRLEVPLDDAVARVALPSMPPQGTHEDLLVVPTTRRAIVGVGPARSVRGDPLGLFRREVGWTERMELFVHPRVAAQPGVTAGWIRDLEGRETSDPSANDVAFHALREYVPGDDRRHIHWRTSARLGRLMVRQFVDTRRAQVALVLSTSSDDYATDEEFELAVSIVASVGTSALADGQDVTCVAAGRRLPAHAPTPLLDRLSGIALSRRGLPLHQTVGGAVRLLRRASVVVLAVGGGVSLAELRTAASRFPSDLRVIAVRAADGADVAVHRSGGMILAELGRLEDLVTVLRGVARR